MSRIDLRQLDDFSPTLVVDLFDGQGIRWDGVAKEFVPYTFYGSSSLRQTQNNPTLTTSTTFVNHQTYTTPVLQPGSYSVAWNIIWYTENVNSLMEVRVQENGVDLVPVNFIDSTSSEEIRRYVSYVTTITLATARALSLTIDLRRIGSNNNVVISASEFTLFAASEV